MSRAFLGAFLGPERRPFMLVLTNALVAVSMVAFAIGSYFSYQAAKTQSQVAKTQQETARVQNETARIQEKTFKGAAP